MLTARDELSHLADTLTEAQAERALAAVRAALPGLYPDGEADLPTRSDRCFGLPT